VGCTGKVLWWWRVCPCSGQDPSHAKEGVQPLKLPNKVFFATRVWRYRTIVCPLVTTSVTSSSVNIVHHATMKPRASAQHCSESDGRLHMRRAFSERDTESGYVLEFPFPRISTLPYSTESTTPHSGNLSHDAERLQQAKVSGLFMRFKTRPSRS
jgi:hypothetical protein